MVDEPAKCKFYPSYRDKHQSCILLNIGKRCDPGRARKCSFGVTQAEYHNGMLRRYSRIALLDEAEQSSIADKYYGGQQPWRWVHE